MSPVLLIASIVGGLVALDVLALCLGYDSRDLNKTPQLLGEDM